MSDSEYCKNLEKPQKKQKGSTYVKPKNKKKQNGRTYVPVSGMGSVLLVFLVILVFPGKTKKTKTKMAEPMSQCLGWGQYFWFFWLFWFFQVKPKKQKKTKWQNLCPSVWDGVSTFVFSGYFGFSR